MEHAAQSLIVITLLQLCRAEISEILPGTWFSANAINDGYSPKPILELFPTEATPSFSPTKPIIVLPSQSSRNPDQEVTHLSTRSPDYYISSTPHTPTSTGHTSFSTTFESSSPVPPSGSYFPASDLYSSENNSLSTAFPPPENFPIFNFPTSPQLPLNSQQTTGEGDDGAQTNTYDVIESNSISTVPPFFVPHSQTQTSAPYLLIYPNNPTSTPFTEQTFTETSSKSPLVFPTVTQQTSDAITPFITNAYSDGTSRPTITFRSTPPTFTTYTTPRTTLFSSTTKLSSCNDPTVKVTFPSTALPPRILPGAPGRPFSPQLKIRVVAPKGSITNIKINPSTTTRRPTTRKMRVKKPKNTHESCVDHCKGKREPICGVPLGTVIVEPKLLKGFPSICHMACHNSFKKEPYEKIVDGRCGRIRTRIIRIDSAKIHKEELKKSEYSIINTGPQTVVELAGSHVYDDKRKH